MRVTALLCGVLLLLGACSPSDEAPVAPAPHGDHSAGPAAPLREGERFLTVGMPRPYTPAGGNDIYRCFVVDPGLTGPAMLTGSQFVPRNTAIVHHAIFFRIAPEQVADAQRADEADEGEGWTCFGDEGIPGDSAWVAHWAPGVSDTPLTPGIGYPMPPGSRMVMQVHYNLMGGTGADQSAVRLRLTDRTDLTPLDTKLLAAPVELPCARGEKGPLCDRSAAVADVAKRFGPQSLGRVEQLGQWCGRGETPAAGTRQQCDYPVEQTGTVYAVGGHMHLLGRSITVDLNPGRDSAKRLLDVPVYNFDEQAVPALPEPVTVRPGDTLRVTCTHDAGLRRQLPALKDLPPRYVVWGEGTADEMCLGLVVWSAA